MDVPETRYARSGDVSVAYQVLGEGPADLVLVPEFVSNVEYMWETPWADGFQRLASFSRLIRFDKRGTGLSDRVGSPPTLETRMDDIRAVMDAVGSSRAVIFGVSEGGAMSMLFAATYPRRCTGLVLYGSFARSIWSSDYPWAMTAEQWRAWMDATVDGWGIPSADLDPELAREVAAIQRQGASPGAARALLQMNMEIDVRHVLSSIHVPTLVLHKKDDFISPEGARWIAGKIAGARFVELSGSQHVSFTEDVDLLIGEIEQFVGDVWDGGAPDDGTEPDRVLTTVLFTDIVGSTARAAELGDARWRELVQAHHEIVRRLLVRFRGTEIDTAGDGFFASFDGPARAIRCACAISEGVRELGIEVRAGLHTGECERIDQKVGGIAVNIGARVASEAGPGEVLVSSTVKDLVAGSGIAFENRGEHELKGIPGTWRLHAVVPA